MDNWAKLYADLAELATAENRICADPFIGPQAKMIARNKRNVYQNVRLMMRVSDASLTGEPADDLHD